MELLIKKPKILYFIKGSVPTDTDRIEANKYDSANVIFRNGNAVNNDDRTEDCDGVAGAVPDVYATRYKSAEEAISVYKKSIADLQKRVGDDKPPAVTKIEDEEEVNEEVAQEIIKEEATKEESPKKAWNAKK